MQVVTQFCYLHCDCNWLFVRKRFSLNKTPNPIFLRWITTPKIFLYPIHLKSQPIANSLTFIILFAGFISINSQPLFGRWKSRTQLKQHDTLSYCSGRLMKLRGGDAKPRLFRAGDVEQMTPKQISISGIWYEYLERACGTNVSLHSYKTSKIDCANGVRHTCYLACERSVGGRAARLRIH